MEDHEGRELSVCSNPTASDSWKQNEESRLAGGQVQAGWWVGPGWLVGGSRPAGGRLRAGWWAGSGWLVVAGRRAESSFHTCQSNSFWVLGSHAWV